MSAELAQFLEDLSEPGPDALLLRIAAHIDDAMLREMAAADYGQDIDAHLAPLLGLRDRGEIPSPLLWEPREVLELIRWSEPDDPEWGPGGHGARGHWMRAFACTALLRAEFDPRNFAARSDGQNQTLAALLVSLDALAASLDHEAAALLAWATSTLIASRAGTDRDRDDEDLAFFGVGLLSLALRLEPPVPDHAIVTLSQSISDTEAELNRQQAAGYGLTPGRWLLSTTYFNINHSKWRAIGSTLLTREFPHRSPEARDWIRLLGASLCED